MEPLLKESACCTTRSGWKNLMLLSVLTSSGFALSWLQMSFFRGGAQRKATHGPNIKMTSIRPMGTATGSWLASGRTHSRCSSWHTHDVQKRVPAIARQGTPLMRGWCNAIATAEVPSETLRAKQQRKAGAEGLTGARVTIGADTRGFEPGGLSEFVTTSAGLKMPRLIFETGSKIVQTEELIPTAVLNDFWGVDVAGQAPYNEPGVGAALKSLFASGVARNTVFIQTKINQTRAAELNLGIPIAKQIELYIAKLLADLGVDYVDSLLLHAPYHAHEEIMEAWLAMEDAVRAGSVRQLGLANVGSLRQLRRIHTEAAVKPAVVQLRFNTGPGLQPGVRAWCADVGIYLQTSSALSSNKHVFGNGVLKNLAEQYGVATPVLFLRFVMGLGVAPLVTTSNEEEMLADSSAWRIPLTLRDAELIDELVQKNLLIPTPNTSPSLPTPTSNVLSSMFVDKGRTVIEAPFDELSELMGGTGKATAIWHSLREGNNPLRIPSRSIVPLQGNKVLSDKARGHLRHLLAGGPHGCSDNNNGHISASRNQHLDELLIPCLVGDENIASCGTRKYLSTLYDGNQIESVLIPSGKFDRTTLCVSTQVGCDRGCKFCATAKMGLVRNLTATEMIAQVVRGLHISKRECMPHLNNIVFMGMGDAGRNLDEVSRAVHCITDGQRLRFGANKVTVSTVGPSPEIFQDMVRLPCTLAWSLHASTDEIRKRLVPSTKHSIAELRDGLISAWQSEPNLRKTRKRALMIAVTLIHGINDSEEDAKRLVEFLRPVQSAIPKLIIDLIPYNDVSVKDFTRPSHENVCKFQKVMQADGFFVSVRITRGDDESAACGMLKTSRQKKKSV